MAYNVTVRDDAFAEALEAYLYYETKLHGLGERFLTSLQAVYAKLATNPGYYSILSSDDKHVFRDVKIRYFPYVIIFTITGTDVFVYAIHNTHKKTAKEV